MSITGVMNCQDTTARLEESEEENRRLQAALFEAENKLDRDAEKAGSV